MSLHISLTCVVVSSKLQILSVPDSRTRPPSYNVAPSRSFMLSAVTTKRANARWTCCAYERWLGQEPDPYELLMPFPSDLMVMWPVSTRVNSPDNDDSSLLDPAA
jgi:hypothetical protein